LPLLLVLAAALAGCDVLFPPGGSAQATRFANGAAAPDIQGEDADGQSFRLSEYRGKVVLLSFWANW
jgi:cytochrome oxidase Cu insertion factor (SCO1/SenC/PrrC family)